MSDFVSAKFAKSFVNNGKAQLVPAGRPAGADNYLRR
jgi:hypothetical protein